MALLRNKQDYIQILIEDKKRNLIKIRTLTKEKREKEKQYEKQFKLFISLLKRKRTNLQKEQDNNKSRKEKIKMGEILTKFNKEIKRLENRSYESITGLSTSIDYLKELNYENVEEVFKSFSNEIEGFCVTVPKEIMDKGLYFIYPYVKDNILVGDLDDLL